MTRKRKKASGQKPDQVQGPAQPKPKTSGADFLSRESFRYYWYAAGACLLAAVILRIAFLGADPPWGFTWSQALFTDGARAIDGAKCKVLFDTWIPDTRSPVMLFYPLLNLIAFVVFKLVGVGLAQANLAGAIPAIVSVVMMFIWMRKLEGDSGGFLALVAMAFFYIHVIYSRVPMVESLLILMLLAGFWFALRRRFGLFISGLLVGLASFMVKMHALHFVPVVLVFLFTGSRDEEGTYAKRLQLAGMFLGGVAAAVVLWAVFVYAVNPEVVAKYFRSNILISQEGEYAGAGLGQILWTRIGAFLHVASGRDAFFAGAPVVSGLAFLGLICVASGMFGGKPEARSWERLAAIWFVGLVGALSLLSYRPLRYMVLLTPSVVLLATAFLLRLVRGRLLASRRNLTFVVAFGIWLTWVLIHIQHDIVYRMAIAGAGAGTTASQAALFSFHRSTLKHILIFGGAAVLITLLLAGRLRTGKLKIPRRLAAGLVVVLLAALVLANTGKFVRYAGGRRYTILDGAATLSRVLSPGAFIVGDCSTTLSLETGFRSLPAYGDLMRYDESEEFGKYPVTHFLLRFPSLYEYLKEKHPDIDQRAEPVTGFVLCGLEATIVHYPDWPGFADSGYRRSGFEVAMGLLRAGQPEDACDALESFVAEKPESYEGHSMLALCKLQMGRTGEAMA
jgi:4-amino-4-deoxy-L-arabinose transferase-like glycosyltransferase